MSRKTASLTFASLMLVGLVCVAAFVPMPYVVMSPGVTENTLGDFDGKPVISIKGHKTYPTTGNLNLTTVSVTSPDYHPVLPSILEAWWSEDEIILPREVVYPPDQTADQVDQQNQADMLGSQQSAIVAGLAEAGIDAVSVQVGKVEADSPADGVLRKDDVILAVDGTPIKSQQDVIDAISPLPPGSEVEVTVKRGDARRTVELTTAESPDDPEKSRIGIEMSDLFAPPFEVNIDLGQDIGGPSAGLMFSLGIYDLITPGSLTGGQFIAGTGTIDQNGNVGPIGGIAQKIAGASAEGATVFLAPADNCDEAAAAPHADEVNLIKVATVDDAVTALESLASGSTDGIQRCD